MLQSIREKTQGWIAGIIISILILSFALWGIHSYLLGGSVSDVVAKVNGVEITQHQLSTAYERMRRQLELRNVNNGLLASADKNLKNQALEALINLQVLQQASLEQNYFVSQIQAESYLESMPDFQENGKFSASRFQQILNMTLYSTSDFINLIKSNLLVEQPRLGIIFSSFSLPNEVSNSIDLINQERDIQYLIIPFKNQNQSSITISPEKIQAYYNEHAEEFKKPEQVSIEYITVSIKDLMDKVQPTEEELKSYYNENKESFNLPAKWKFISVIIPASSDASQDEQANKEADKVYNLDVMKKITSEKDIATVAKEIGVPKANVNVHDYVTLQGIPADIQSAIAKETTPGKTLKPIRTQSGFVIIKLVDYKAPTVQTYDQVKDQVKQAVVGPKVEEQFANIKEKLANTTYEHPESLKDASSALNLPIKETAPFTKDKGTDSVSNNPKVREIAFSDDVLNVKNNSDVINLDPNTILVLRIKTHSPATAIPLNEVKEQIASKLKAVAIETETSELANQFLSKLQAGTNSEELAKQHQLSWISTNYLTRHSTKIDASILNAAFELPSSSTKQFAIAKLPNGFAIVTVNSVKPGALTPNENYDVFAEQVQNTQGLLEYELYKQSMVKQADIKVNGTAS